MKTYSPTIRGVLVIVHVVAEFDVFVFIGVYCQLNTISFSSVGNPDSITYCNLLLSEWYNPPFEISSEPSTTLKDIIDAANNSRTRQTQQRLNI